MKPKAGNTRKSINDCEACAVGSFCSSGSTGTCPVGYNCPSYATDQTMLPSQPGLKTSAATPSTSFSDCEYEYCPGKSASGATSYCPGGFYNNFASFTKNHFTSASCAPNPAGTYTLAASSTVSSIANNYQACTAGNYCPEGTDIPIKCPTGSFSASSAKNLNECTTCTAGSFCALGSSAIGLCTSGHYCPKQTFFSLEFQCPIGSTKAAGGGQS